MDLHDDFPALRCDLGVLADDATIGLESEQGGNTERLTTFNEPEGPVQGESAGRGAEGAAAEQAAGAGAFPKGSLFQANPAFPSSRANASISPASRGGGPRPASAVVTAVVTAPSPPTLNAGLDSETPAPPLESNRAGTPETGALQNYRPFQFCLRTLDRADIGQGSRYERRRLLDEFARELQRHFMENDRVGQCVLALRMEFGPVGRSDY